MSYSDSSVGEPSRNFSVERLCEKLSRSVIIIIISEENEKEKRKEK